MSRITVTDQNTTSKNHVIAVNTREEYQDLGEELSHFATIFNDQMRNILPVDEFVTPDIEMHGKLRWKFSRFIMDPYGSLEVKGNKIWLAYPDFKQQYIKFFNAVTEPKSEKEISRMTDNERAIYESNQQLLEQDMQTLRNYIGVTSGNTMEEVMEQYPDEDAFRNWISYNFIAAEYAEYYLLQLGLTVSELGGYTKFVGLAALLGQAARTGITVGDDNTPALEAGKTADFIVSMYARQREHDINKEKIIRHPFLESARTLDFAPLAWITYEANTFADTYSQDLNAVKTLMDILTSKATQGKITNKIFLEAVATAYHQSLDDMNQCEYLRLMYETMPEEDK